VLSLDIACVYYKIHRNSGCELVCHGSFLHSLQDRKNNYNQDIMKIYYLGSMQATDNKIRTQFFP